MRLVPSGTFLMGSDAHYREESPARMAWCDAFLMDEAPVTNAEFARFVAATGWRTAAETAPPAFAGAPSGDAPAGSAVFRPPPGPVLRLDPTNWWAFVPGAHWRDPTGTGVPDAAALPDHPVVHVGHDDALAFARWAGKSLPTEIEWERAARGGLDGATFAWGEELEPGGVTMANIWHGRFPFEDRAAPRAVRTTPVRCYPPNAFGFHDMIGNVWEWTADRFDMSDRHVIKGGSHLCSPDHCRRYRPAARQGQHGADTTSHVGFRCVARPGSSP